MRLAGPAISFVVLLVSPCAFGQEQEPACDMNYTEFSNNAPAFGEFILTLNSANARTLPDFRNAAVNYFFHDSDGSRLLGYLGGGGQIRIPICNELGQCVQAEAEIRFGTSGSAGGGAGGFDISIDLFVGIDGHNISVEDAGGNRLTYQAEENQRELAIPSAGPPGGLLYQDKTCRNNDHTAEDPADQNEEGQPPSGNGSSDSGGGGNIGDGNGGDHPSGGTFVYGAGGLGGGECWLVEARDSEGNFLGFYTLCY